MAHPSKHFELFLHFKNDLKKIWITIELENNSAKS